MGSCQEESEYQYCGGDPVGAVDSDGSSTTYYCWFDVITPTLYECDGDMYYKQDAAYNAWHVTKISWMGGSFHKIAQGKLIGTVWFTIKEHTVPEGEWPSGGRSVYMDKSNYCEPPSYNSFNKGSAKHGTLPTLNVEFKARDGSVGDRSYTF